jgi:hypothetical protein
MGRHGRLLQPHQVALENSDIKAQVIWFFPSLMEHAKAVPGRYSGSLQVDTA